ncbi:MAG: hypothetical protein IKJ09_00675 [Bacteroidaceae bacterium]|nr:hypothetical protein [Bacteroidaceae bacterium]
MIGFIDKLKSNNTEAYGIVDADEVSGHKSVNALSDLYTLKDAILSSNAKNKNNDAIGQLWYVTSEGRYYQLIDWSKRNSADGWKPYNIPVDTESINDNSVTKQKLSGELRAIIEKVTVFLNSSAVSDDIIDTLKEIQEYIKSDTTGAVSMTDSIQKNTSAIAILQQESENLKNKDLELESGLNSKEATLNYYTGEDTISVAIMESGMTIAKVKTQNVAKMLLSYGSVVKQEVDLTLGEQSIALGDADFMVVNIVRIAASTDAAVGITMRTMND